MGHFIEFHYIYIYIYYLQEARIFCIFTKPPLDLRPNCTKINYALLLFTNSPLRKTQMT